MKAVMALLGVGILFLMLGGIMYGIENFRGTDRVEPFNVTTDGSTTNVNETLSMAVLDDSIGNITVTSTDTDDAPIPYTYAKATKILTINGLAISTTRTLTVTYKVQRQDTTADVGAKYLPTFLILGGVAAVAGGVISAFKR